MIYENILEGIFIDRPNRFIANIEIDGKTETVHVKNTGRCKELLIPRAKVFVKKENNPNRKTGFSLISVYKGETLINMDSQIPNYVVFEGLSENKIGEIKASDIKKEQKYKDSRFDISFYENGAKAFMEVKGVTLENDGIAMFPDAPTLRGAKHIHHLIDAAGEGYKAYIMFLVQMKGVNSFVPNDKTDPEFAAALRKAHESGVNILCYDSVVSKDSIVISEKVPVVL